MSSTGRSAPPLQRGELVVLRNWKFDGNPHWVVPGEWLGSDQHGSWVAQRRGAFCSRPGIGFFAASDALLLVPHTGEWVATFYDANNPDGVQLYVDIATRIGWHRLGSGTVEVNLIDMDLDVLKVARSPRRPDPVFIDDADEFADHSVQMNYPDALIARMQEECARIHAEVLAGTAPFDGIPVEGSPGGTAARWFTELKDLPAAAVRYLHHRTKAGT